MINDTPSSLKTARTTKPAKLSSKAKYNGGFHIKSAAQKKKSSASKRSACQTFTFG